MNSYITDSVRLLGLIVKTKPFTYENEIVYCDFQSHVDLDQLKQIKVDIQHQIDTLPEGTTDYERRLMQDDLYFIDTTIQEIESKVQ